MLYIKVILWQRYYFSIIFKRGIKDLKMFQIFEYSCPVNTWAG